jgi:hypothetical protein
MTTGGGTLVWSKEACIAACNCSSSVATNLAEKQNDSKINNDREKQKQVVNNINDSLNNISSLSESESSMLDNTGSSDNLCLSEERNYKQYLGQETGELAMIWLVMT